MKAIEKQIDQALGKVRDQSSFLHDLLGNVLEWPIEKHVGKLDDISFGWTADELRVNELEQRLVAGQIWQIQPMRTDQPWGIFLLEFQNPDVFTTGRGMTGPLRKVLRGLVPSRRRQPGLAAWSRENLLFICTHEYKHFRFAHFRTPAEGSRVAALATFGWGPDMPARTACEFNFPALIWPGDNVPPEDWIKRWGAAFDVEKVTKRFYEDYEDVFKMVEAQIPKTLKPEADRRLYTQQLFNRLMFLRFIERKNWLRFRGRTDYLRALFEAGGTDRKSFYQARVRPLFFEGLALPGHGESEAIGEVPFLNGGLFEENELDRRVPDIPDAAFKYIIGEGGLFYRYNFTVEESTPLDIEVAVDPEMLGKVFEELVTGRHDTGSYYTPRPIVSFMCRAALKGYLTHQTSASAADIAALVDRADEQRLNFTQAREVMDALDQLRAVDPACGSGAYLLGLLQEMVLLYRTLYSAKLREDSRSLLKLKERIVRNNLYGVDNDPFAVNIAMLRLWLSLAVEADDPLPLPNLDFRVECGDSLASPGPQLGQDELRSRDEVASYARLKAQFEDNKFDGDKTDVRRQIVRMREDIARWRHPGQKTQRFDWAVDYAEVFAPRDAAPTLLGELSLGYQLAPSRGPGGFDIVLANPPYVRQERIKDQKPALKLVFPEVYSGTTDLYCYFYARALQLLRPGGMLAFISSNKWFRAAYGANLRKHIAENCRVVSITDFGDLPVFQKATAYPMIFIAQKFKPDGSTRLTEVKSLDPPYPDVLTLVEQQGQALPPEALNGPHWSLLGHSDAARIQQMAKKGIPLGEYVKGQIYRGVLTGFNKAFIIDGAKRAELIQEDPTSAEIIKPLVTGKDIRRWHIEPHDRWVIFTRRGVSIDSYPVIKNHLDKWRVNLEPKPRDWGKDREWLGRKPGSYKWYEIQDEVAYYPEFEKPKIVFPDIARAPRFAVAPGGFFSNDTTFFIRGDDLYLLALLNSQPVLQFFVELCAQVRGSYLRYKRQYVVQIPVPDAASADRATLSELVQRCLDAKGEGCEAWEREIDERVAGLYGL